MSLYCISKQHLSAIKKDFAIQYLIYHCHVQLNSLLRCTQTSKLGLKQTIKIIRVGLCYDCLVMVELARRKWHWVGHILRKDSGNITKEAMGKGNGRDPELRGEGPPK